MALVNESFGYMKYKQIKYEKIRKLSWELQFELFIKAIVFSNPLYEKILLTDVSGRIQNVIPFVCDARFTVNFEACSTGRLLVASGFD